MTPAAVLAQFRSRNVVLSLDGDGLTFDAPNGELTPDDFELLRRSKSELVAHLTSANSESQSHMATYGIRAMVASWSIEWRERWGRLANRFMLEGYAWPADELKAYEQVTAEGEEGTEPVSLEPNITAISSRNTP